MKIDTGKMPEKILDLGRYHLSLVDTLHNYPSVSEKIGNAAGKTLVKYFEEYYANLTRTNRYLYQHVYEFDKAGDNKYKLFKANISSAAGVAKIKYNFIDSKIPNKNGYIFKNKASVMESGQEVIIKPKNSQVLVFDINGDTVFSKSEITVKNPGGNVAGNFEEQFNKYMKSNAKQVLISSGFIKKINLLIKGESEIVGKKITMIPGAGVKYAKQSATKIANIMDVISND